MEKLNFQTPKLCFFNFFRNVALAVGLYNSRINYKNGKTIGRVKYALT